MSKSRAFLAVGICLLLVGLVALGAFGYHYQSHKYGNPELTETQLSLWRLARWYVWVPAALVTAVGLGMMKVSVWKGRE